MAKALRVLPGPTKRRIIVSFPKDEAPICEDKVLARMRVALDVGSHERVLGVQVLVRQYDTACRAFVFEGVAEVMAGRNVPEIN